MSDVIELRAGSAVACLLPQAGGRLASLKLCPPEGGEAQDVLYPYPLDAPFDPLRWAKGGMYPLMPYSNRIAQGRLHFQGQTHALQPHPDAAPHTLHGNAHAQAWQASAVLASSATMTLDSPASAAWPWRYQARLDVVLLPSQLEVVLTLRNADSHPMPAGMGLHPYFMHRPDARLGYQATTFWPATAEYLPLSPRPLQDGEQQLPPSPLRDGGLTDYVSGWNGEATLDLPQGGQLRVEADPLFGHLVVHRPERPVYLCLEPVSHVADGFNLADGGMPGTGTVVLQPGESLCGSMRFVLTQSPVSSLQSL